MKEAFLSLARQSSLYALGNILLKIGGFLLAFIYLDPQYLAEAAYGRLALLEVTASVLIPILTLGLGSGLLKFWADPTYQDTRDDLSFTALATTAGLALCGFLLLYLLAEPTAGLLLGSFRFAALIKLLAIYVAFRIVLSTSIAHLRNEEKPGLIALSIALEMVLLIGGVYYFVVVQLEALEGVMKAYVLSSGARATVVSVGVLTTITWSFRPEFLHRLFRFGMPLAWVGVGGMLLNLGDRYLVQWILGPVEVGIYGWSGRLSNVLYLLFVSSFGSAFGVLGVKSLHDEDDDFGFHRRTFRHFVIITGWATIGLSLFAYDVTVLVADSSVYLYAEYLVLPLTIGYLLFGVYTLIMNLLYAGGKSGTIARNIFLAALLNILLNLVLIPSLGTIGAALATVISYAGLVAITTHVAYQHSATRFPWMVLAKVLALVAGLYLLGRLTFEWEMYARLTGRLLIVAAYPLGVYLWRLYSREEWRELGQLIYGRFRA